MKRYIALALACMLLFLCGCSGGAPAASAEATPTPTIEPTPTPAPVYVNPLNGEILDAPFTNRVFASTVCNTPNAVPHISLNEADVYMEMFVNGSVIRGLALYSDIRDVEVFGSVRSTRLMFNEIVEHYDAVLIHSGAATNVINDYQNRGIDNFNIDAWAVKNAGTSYRDKEYGRDYEASLFGLGQGCYDYAEAQGMNLTQSAEKSYGLEFTDEGTPENGEAANLVSVRFKYNGSSKLTEMKYDAQLDKYVYWQYVQEMRDQITDEPEAFTNVIIMNTDIKLSGMYHTTEFTEGGDGWYACGGKLVPIKWSCAGDYEPFVFTTMDGEVLQLERGNTYIAIAPIGSEIIWE